MEFSIKLDIEGSQAIIFKKVVFLSLKIDFIFANRADPDEMLHNAAFHLGLHCLQKYLFMGFLVYKQLKLFYNSSWYQH